jgi:hypothetical protein
MLLNRIGGLMRVAAGVLSLFLLIPIPVYAVISFGSWMPMSGSWTDNGSTPAGSDTSTLFIQPSTSSTPAGTTAIFTFQVAVTFQPGDQLQVTGSDLSGLHLDGGSLQIQIAVMPIVGTPSVFLTNPNPNQFSGSTNLTLSASNTSFANPNGSPTTFDLQVMFTFGDTNNLTSWSTTSTPSQLSISFGHP